MKIIKNIISEKRKVKITCNCGAKYDGTNHRTRHEKTQKHFAWLRNEIQTKTETI